MYHYLLKLISQKLNLSICSIELAFESTKRLAYIQTIHHHTHHLSIQLSPLHMPPTSASRGVIYLINSFLHWICKTYTVYKKNYVLSFLIIFWNVHLIWNISIGIYKNCHNFKVYTFLHTQRHGLKIGGSMCEPLKAEGSRRQGRWSVRRACPLRQWGWGLGMGLCPLPTKFF